MNSTSIYHLFLAGILFILIFWFLRMLMKTYQTNESMTNMKSSTSGSSNGIAGNASAYESTIQAAVIKNQDELLISKYRTDYENVILKMDDLVNNLMLQTVLTVDFTNPMKSISNLSALNNSKLALNSVMKFVDASK